jgi:hypothetical protein
MKKLSSFQEVQGILTLAYVYLILMGILNESLYYNQLDINILNYSDVLDILISPIAKMTSSSAGFVVFLLMIFALFWLPKYFVKKRDKRWFQKSFKMKEGLNAEEMRSSFFYLALFMIALFLTGFYVGTGLGSGHKLQKRMDNKEVLFNDKLYFLNQNESTVEIIGKNSSYIFYLEPGSPVVKVSPISGVILKIEEIRDWKTPLKE